MPGPLKLNPNKSIEETIALIELQIGFVPPAVRAQYGLLGTVNECLGLLEGRLSKIASKTDTKSVRMIHHLSCTGGTLITKCVAALPNILMLNEVDPLSPIPFNSTQSRFTPTDMVALLRQSDTQPTPETIINLFAQQITFLLNENFLIGRALVIRDHSHSQFLTGDTIPDRPTVRDMLRGIMPVRSIVTVRDPIDSYLSLQNHGWDQHFSPSSFEEYCRRYLIFLDKYKGVDIIRYEDFVAKPEVVMQKICGALNLNYSKKFARLFGAYQFSGDSGRSGDVIEVRPKRELEEGLRNEGFRSASYAHLRQVLGYQSPSK